MSLTGVILAVIIILPIALAVMAFNYVKFYMEYGDKFRYGIIGVAVALIASEFWLCARVYNMNSTQQPAQQPAQQPPYQY